MWSNRTIKINRSAKVWTLFAGLFFSLNSCFNGRDQNLANNLTLAEATKIGSYSFFDLQDLWAQSGYNVNITIQYDVDIYQVTYKTKYKGDPVFASGVVILPVASEAGMISLHHGTIVTSEEAPSASPSSNPDMVLYSIVASLGFITAVPDYIGFGSSSHIFHPYYVEELSASAVVDLLKASKELADREKLKFNQKLFLAGYSEGGYVTMAAHKYIQTNGLNGFRLLASFPAAGGYDVKGVQKYLFSLSSYSNPYYIGYVALAYRSVYDWQQPLTDFFNEPYATKMPDLFDGLHSSDDINNKLSTSIAELINKNLITSLETNSKFAYINDALKKNSLTSWKPTIKMFMYHGDADTTVPYKSSTDTYNKLISNGAPHDILQLITLPGADHGTGLKPYVEDALPKMMSIYTSSP